MTVKEKIVSRSLEMLSNSPNGLRFSELHKELEKAGDLNKNTITGTLIKLDSYSDLIAKPSKGLFKHVKFLLQEPSLEAVKFTKIKESDFYDSFAEWIVTDLEECTKAISLGGAKFGSKWGTPDVIGVKEPRKSDIIQFHPEVITAEIKLDSTQLITAFGQVCAYKLFSHKSFLVIPKASSKEDIDRIDSLCMIYNIGLVLFDSKNPKNPNFEIRVRALKHDPDMYYLNENLKIIEKDLF